MNGISSPRLESMIAQIEGQSTKIMVDSVSREFTLAEPVAIDSDEPAISVLDSPWMRNIAQPDTEELHEADQIAAFYEGVPYAIGRERELDYRRQKATGVAIAAAGSRR